MASELYHMSDECFKKKLAMKKDSKFWNYLTEGFKNKNTIYHLNNSTTILKRKIFNSVICDSKKILISMLF